VSVRELLEHPLLAPAIVALVAAVGAWAWQRVAEARLATLKADRERAALEDEQAERAKDRVKELKARDGLTDPEAENEAVKDFKQRVKGATDESARSAVLAAVGRDPEIGKSAETDKDKS
jgi:hypothetical protein